MTAYASYLPKDADQVNNGVVTACLNCGFEFLAGVAIFSLLFTFAIAPQASTIAMTFFVIPEGIAAMPVGVVAFGVLFFLLMLLAGLSSSISLIEGINCAMIDKFGWSRRRTPVGHRLRRADRQRLLRLTRGGRPRASRATAPSGFRSST